EHLELTGLRKCLSLCQLELNTLGIQPIDAAEIEYAPEQVDQPAHRNAAAQVGDNVGILHVETQQMAVNAREHLVNAAAHKTDQYDQDHDPARGHVRAEKAAIDWPELPGQYKTDHRPPDRQGGSLHPGQIGNTGKGNAQDPYPCPANDMQHPEQTVTIGAGHQIGKVDHGKSGMLQHRQTSHCSLAE